MIDRGFSKWQPFNSLLSAKTIFKEITNNKIIDKPTLFLEGQQELNEKILEAYYTQSIITLTYYYNNKIYKIKTKIKEIEPSFNTFKLDNNRIISFYQVIQIN